MAEGQLLPISITHSPISKLYDDLLWTIFRKNADISHREVEDKFPALRTLVYTSLVCSRWRNLALGLPSLWAAVINLDILADEGWRKEFIKRAGDASLSVVGHKEVAGDRNTELIVSFLEEHWERIRFLDVRFGYINWRTFEDRIWNILARPANALQVFKLFPPLDRFNMDGKPLYVSRPPTLVLFDDNAPVLHTFHAPGIRANLNAPWLSNLCDLSLNGPLPVNELLSALAQMQCLQALRDNCDAITAAAAGTVLPKVTCSSLQTINISTYRGIQPYAELITHLTPAPNCAFSFVVVADDGFLFDAQAVSATSQILRRLPYYCDFGSAISISATLHGRSFEFQAAFTPDIACVFVLALACVPEVPSNYTQVLLSTLTTLPLHNAKKLALVIGESADISIVDPEVAEFVSSFSFTRELELSSDTIQFILTLPQDIQVMAFPSVEKVYLTTCSAELDVICIQAFLASRIAVGHPVQELEIRIPEFGIGLNLSCLEEFIGLKVFLTIQGFSRSYVCGSGLADELFI